MGQPETTPPGNIACGQNIDTFLLACFFESKCCYMQGEGQIRKGADGKMNHG
jgi:hypothetical protein